MSEFLASTTGILTIVAAIGGFVYLYRNVQAQSGRANLDAKDAAILTQTQVNQANEQRIEQLEKTVVRLSKENGEMKAKIQILEDYAAPEAIKRFEEQQAIMIEILRSIQSELEKR